MKIFSTSFILAGLLAVTSIFSVTAKADLYNADVFTEGDGLGGFVDGQDLLWLDVTETASLSYDQALIQYQADGFRYATNEEVITLFTKAFPTLSEEFTFVSGKTPTESFETYINAFQSVFGVFNGANRHTYGFYEDEDGYLRIMGSRYRSDESSYYIAGPQHGSSYEYYRDSHSISFGVWMVKDLSLEESTSLRSDLGLSSASISDVPAGGGLFLLGVFLLLRNRKR